MAIEKQVDEIMQEYDNVPDFDSVEWLRRKFTELLTR